MDQILFSRDEEKCLVDHLIYMSNIGYGYSRQSFLDMAFEFAIILGKKSQNDPSFKGSLYKGFKRRWPEMHLAKPERLSTVRAKSASKESLSTHFSGLEDTFIELDLHKHPERIWNIDETGILTKGPMSQG